MPAPRVPRLMPALAPLVFALAPAGWSAAPARAVDLPSVAPTLDCAALVERDFTGVDGGWW